MPPLRFFIDSPFSNAAQTSNQLSINSADPRGNLAPWRFVHKWHELVREPRHRTADANSSHVWTAADAVDPAAFGHVAFDHRSPAAELDDALGRAVFGGKIALLVISGSAPALVHGLTKKPCGTELIVQGNHRCLACRLIEQIKNRLRQVVGMDRAAGHANDRDTGFRFSAPPSIIGQRS